MFDLNGIRFPNTLKFVNMSAFALGQPAQKLLKGIKSKTVISLKRQLILHHKSPSTIY